MIAGRITITMTGLQNGLMQYDYLKKQVLILLWCRSNIWLFKRYSKALTV